MKNITEKTKTQEIKFGMEDKVWTIREYRLNTIWETIMANIGGTTEQQIFNNEIPRVLRKTSQNLLTLENTMVKYLKPTKAESVIGTPGI
jgi:hypothetical protein